MYNIVLGNLKCSFTSIRLVSTVFNVVHIPGIFTMGLEKDLVPGSVSGR